MSNPALHAARDARILADLQDAVTRMHVIPGEPRVVFAKGTRTEGARPMAWQVLFERIFGPGAPPMRYRGTASTNLGAVIAAGFDSEPGLELDSWSHLRLADAMAQGPVIQAFRADRLPDDVSRALVGLLVFEEDELRVEQVRSLVARWAQP
ncbi:MAG TPA: hypothetical protein VE869_08455 [Gemmatimonas sp.]|nr:hypothetical protein [Gemmatimonas sp.]